jgi:chromate transporter
MIDRRSLTYFREEFVVRRRWLDEQAYADLVGCASSCPAPPAARSDFPSGS